MKIKLLLCVLLLLLLQFSAFSQITVYPDTPLNLIHNVFLGGGVVPSNLISQGSALQFGRFQGGGAVIGINEGMVLSTKKLSSANALAPGALWSDGAGTPGDSLLSSVSNGAASYNAAILQFDFTPIGDTLHFEYVFASAEYNSYVNFVFNDVFAFFLTGPNPDPNLPAYNNTNIALVPGTNTPVTINTVNNGLSMGCGHGPCVNCAYFVDNCLGTYPLGGFGGFTVPLKVTAPVVQCSTYTIRIGIVDIGDDRLNSAVFFKKGSFGTGGVSLQSEVKITGYESLITDNSTLYKGCTNAELTFVRSGDLANTDTVFFNVSGTAQEGTDYSISPAGTMLIFQPGQDTAKIIVDPFDNNLPNDGKTIIVEIIDSSLCQNTVRNSLTLTIREVKELKTVTLTDTICTGDEIALIAQYTGGSPYVKIVWENGILDSGLYTSPHSETIRYSIYDICADTLMKDSLKIVHYKDPFFKLEDQVICEGFSTQIGVPDSVNYSFLWNTLDTTSYITVADSGQYILSVTNFCNYSYSDTMQLSFIANIGEFVLPNVITPNGDGANDEYSLPQLELAESFDLSIYNRWGNLVFATSDFNNMWKGETNLGTEASDGVYFAVLKYVSCNGKEFKSSSFVYLIRNE